MTCRCRTGTIKSPSRTVGKSAQLKLRKGEIHVFIENDLEHAVEAHGPQGDAREVRALSVEGDVVAESEEVEDRVKERGYHSQDEKFGVRLQQNLATRRIEKHQAHE